MAKRKRYIDMPTEPDTTSMDLLKAAVTQCANVKTILRDIKTLLKLRAVVRQKGLKKLRDESK